MDTEEEKNRRANRLLDNIKMAKDRVTDISTQRDKRAIRKAFGSPNLKLTLTDEKLWPDKPVKLTYWQKIVALYVDWWDKKYDDPEYDSQPHILDWVHTGIAVVFMFAFAYWAL